MEKFRKISNAISPAVSIAIGLQGLAVIFAPSPVRAAGPDFLWDAGTGNNGLLGSTVLMATELNKLLNGSTALNTTVITNASTGQAIWATIQVALASTLAACTSGGNLSGWFLSSLDGSTFESATTAGLPRSPDFIIPLAAASTAGNFNASGLVRVPAPNFKTLIQNNCGSTLGTTNTVTIGYHSVKY